MNSITNSACLLVSLHLGVSGVSCGRERRGFLHMKTTLQLGNTTKNRFTLPTRFKHFNHIKLSSKQLLLSRGFLIHELKQSNNVKIKICEMNFYLLTQITTELSTYTTSSLLRRASREIDF